MTGSYVLDYFDTLFDIVFGHLVRFFVLNLINLVFYYIYPFDFARTCRTQMWYHVQMKRLLSLDTSRPTLSVFLHIIEDRFSSNAHVKITF